MEFGKQGDYNKAASCFSWSFRFFKDVNPSLAGLTIFLELQALALLIQANEDFLESIQSYVVTNKKFPVTEIVQRAIKACENLPILENSHQVEGRQATTNIPKQVTVDPLLRRKIFIFQVEFLFRDQQVERAIEALVELSQDLFDNDTSLLETLCNRIMFRDECPVQGDRTIFVEA